MKFLKEGEWMVSTPVYVGLPETLIKMTKCDHPEWGNMTVRPTIEGGHEMFMQRCEFCSATRVRFRNTK